MNSGLLRGDTVGL